MFNIENEYTTEPIEIEVLASIEAQLIVATSLLTNWHENPGKSDLPETWKGAKDLAQDMVKRTVLSREKENADGVSVQWVTSSRM